MVRYGSKEVLQILAIRPHVLRYWEQQLPLIRAERDETGHRVWTEAQVRILQRLAHLVQDRGMAVQAAGDAILREADAGAGNVKGALEAVRHELMTVLHRLRRYRHTVEVPQVPGKAPVTDDRLSLRSASGEGTLTPATGEWNPVEQGGILPPGHATRRGRSNASPGLERRFRMSVHPTDPSPRTEILRIAYRHLLAYAAGSRSDPSEVPGVLAAILRYRFRSIPSALSASIIEHTVVCAPPEEADRYREAFSSWNGAVPAVLSVPYLSYEGARWVSPLLAVLIALRNDPSWESVVNSRGRRIGYLWAPENPDLPVDLPVAPGIGRHAASPITEPILIGHPGPVSSLLGEGLLIPLGDASLLDDLVGHGGWSLGKVLDWNGTDADTFSVRWRYDLLLRDLLARRPRWIALPRSDRPALWRGDSWRRQMPAVWPEIDLAER